MKNNTTVNGSGRYRSLILSISLFLALIGALLAYTFYTSSVIEKNTALIDISNKVANNAQSVIKDVFDIQNSYGEDINSPHMQTVLSRLDQNTKQIGGLIDAMKTGGTVTDANGNNIQLPSLKDPAALQSLQNTEAEWNQLKPKVEDYLAVASDIRKDSSVQLAIVGEQAKTSSLAINESLNGLTQDVFEDSQQQANTIRLIQILGVAAILGYFLIFVFFFVRRLRESDAEALEARRETQEIMETVSTGLFLLDKDLNIGQQHSKALEGIIGTDRLAGENFTNILRGRISEKDLTTTRQFIEQLYNPRVKEKLVEDLNPLHKVLLHNTSSDQVNDNRYLDFKFSRVYENKDIARILVNVTDVSDAVRLEERLEKERAQNDMQIEMLATILNVEPKIINDFIVNTKVHIEKMNNILKNPGSSQFELESKLKSIYREMHSLKGEASALKLHSFTKIASEAEDKLFAMQNQGALSGNDFLPLAVHLDDLLSLSNTIEVLGERINQASPVAMANQQAVKQSSTEQVISSSVTPAPIHVTTTNAIDLEDDGTIDLGNHVQGLKEYYQEFANEIASRQQKSVTLETQGVNDQTIPESLATATREITIQMLRNAIVHGIEKPAQREAAGKSATGHIKLSLENTGDKLNIILQDDGQGINFDTIKRRLIAMGKNTAEEAETLSQNQLLSALFISGFTTRDAADEDGGRGVGLDIIKDRVKELNGQLKVNTEKGKMTRFIISLPITSSL